MCGLLVRAALCPPTPDERVIEDQGWQRAMARLSRRGPDAEGESHTPDSAVRLAHTRLAINDLSTAGAQPMTCPRRGHTIVFNGEIYNAADLRRELIGLGHQFRSRCDTEVLLHGYAQWGGEGLLQRIMGMYALVIWNAASGGGGEQIAAVDHVGMKPLCWSLEDGVLRLASDLDALVEILPRSPALSREAMARVLLLGYSPAPQTVWQGAYKLEPGSALRWRPGQTSPTIWTHWQPVRECTAAPRDPRRDLAPPTNEFSDLWMRIIAEHLTSDVPVGLFLSGGVDSASVAAGLAALHAPHPSSVTAITLAMPGAADESMAAAAIAQACGHRHIRIECSAADVDDLLHAAAEAYDEPQTFGALLTATAVARAAREHVKVVLSGDGGDEAFGGYAWHSEPFESGASHLSRVMPRFTFDEVQRLIPDSGLSAEAIAEWANSLDAPAMPHPRRAQRFDLLTFCAGSILPKVDRAAMAVGLEVRAPMLDRRLLDWSLSRPVSKDERGGGSAKSLLREYLAPRLSKDMLARPKQGFSLRLGDRDPWPEMFPRLAETRLVRDVLGESWRAVVEAPHPMRSQRMYSLLALAAWLEAR